MNLFQQFICKEIGISDKPIIYDTNVSIYSFSEPSGLIKQSHHFIQYETNNQTNPVFFFLYSFLSVGLIDSKTKFYLLDMVLSNSFINYEYKIKSFQTFCRVQRRYHTFARFVNKWKRSNTKIQVDYDMCLIPINRQTTPHIIIYQNNAGYIFKIADLINIINSSLLHSMQFFADPFFPKNPYTNMPFTIAMMYHIYTSIRKSDFRMPIIIQLFYDANFEIEQFIYDNEATIRDMHIKDFVKNSTTNVLRKHVNEMIYCIHPTGRRLCISSDFPNDLLIDIMRPYLYLYLINCYSLVRSDKKVGSLRKLLEKMNEFINYNPFFGRKECILCNGTYKTRYNSKHIPFSMNDAYNYNHIVEIEMDSDDETTDRSDEVDSVS